MPRPSADYWQDYPSGGTARSAANLNAREDAILDYAEEIDTDAVSVAPAAAQTITPTSDVPALTLKSSSGAAANSTILEAKDTTAANALRASLTNQGTLRVLAASTLVPTVDTFVAGDTQPRVRVTPAGLYFGAGSTSALDASVTRGIDSDSNPELLVANPATSANGVRIRLTGGMVLTAASGASHLGDSNKWLPLFVSGIVGDSHTSTSYATIRSYMQYRKTNQASEANVLPLGIQSYLLVGDDGSLAKGTGHAFTSNITVTNSTAESEHASWVTYFRYDGGGGRAWLADWNLHGRITSQQSLLSGCNVFINNHYNGSPANSPSYAYAALTYQALGGGKHASNPTSYSNDIGFWVLGASGSGGATRGWEVAYKVGHGVHPRSGSALGSTGSWYIPSSRVGIGLLVDDYDVNGISIASRKSGTGSAIKIAGGMDLELVEGAAPAATANSARIWAEDNGAGKTRLMVRFGSGANQQIAIEP